MIQYRLARPDDVVAIHSHYEVTRPLSWPTIVAMKGNDVVGYLSTHDDKNAVIAGPFECDAPIIGYRLIEVYEAFLQSLGISEYLFYIDKKQEDWIQQVMRVPGTIPYQDDNDIVWFKRTLKWAAKA